MSLPFSLIPWKHVVSFSDYLFVDMLQNRIQTMQKRQKKSFYGGREKQPPELFYKKRCSYKFWKYPRTPLQHSTSGRLLLGKSLDYIFIYYKFFTSILNKAFNLKKTILRMLLKICYIKLENILLLKYSIFMVNALWSLSKNLWCQSNRIFVSWK